MDTITRASLYFPTRSLSAFWILSNMVVNNQNDCSDAQQWILTALIVVFALFVVMVAFTDTYVASNLQMYPVMIFPVYGPVCFDLPSLEDKDKVYGAYYLKIRDYLHALLSCATFVLIVVFISPISYCLYPSDDGVGSKFTSSTVRTVPIVVALICALLMMCLGPPRQMLGYVNVPETCPPLETMMGANPIYGTDEAGSEFGDALGMMPPTPQFSQASTYRSYNSQVMKSQSRRDPYGSRRSMQQQQSRSRSRSPGPGGPTRPSPSHRDNPSNRGGDPGPGGPPPWDGPHGDSDNEEYNNNY